MGRTFRHISYEQRQVIERMYNKLGCSAQVIADTLGFHFTTIYKELKRGSCQQVDSLLCPYTIYSADVAQQDYDRKATAKGAGLKIDKDFQLAAHIEQRIGRDGYSPRAVLGEIRAQGLPFKTRISYTTLYRYIDMGLFLNISNKHLVYGKRRHRHYRKVQRLALNGVLRTSISERPNLEARDEFGHWEMDTVVGKAQGKSTCLLVLTERMTRLECIIKLKQNSAAHVVKAIDALHRKYRPVFRKMFKSITVDNGSEFSDTAGIERGGRTAVYYCHPYSSWERGSNENANRMIRRFIPKGSDIDQYTKAQIQQIEHWMNHYPRHIFDYKNSNQLFQEEMRKLIAT